MSTIFLNPYFIETFVNFISNKSLDLDGTQSVTIPDSDDFSFGNQTVDQPFSVSVRVFLTSANVNNKGLIGKRDTTSVFDAEWALATDGSGRLNFTLLDKSESSFMSRRTGTSLPLYRWLTIVGTYDGSGTRAGIKIYINGRRQDSADDGTGTYTAMENTTHPVSLGTDGRSGTLMTGKLDQAMLWNKELSFLEIQELQTLRNLNYHSAYDDALIWAEFEDDDISGTTLTLKKGGTGTLNSGASNVPCVGYPYSYQLENTDQAFYHEWGGLMWALDGVNDYIEVPNSTDFSFGNGLGDTPFSVSVWFSLDNQGNDQRLIRKSGSTGNEWAVAVDGSGRINFLVFDNISNYLFVRTPDSESVGIRKINHVVCTYDGNGFSGMKVYINGKEVSSYIDVSAGTYVAMNASAQPVHIGHYESSGNYFDGHIGDCIIFDKELSQAEVRAIFNSNKPRKEEEESLSANIVGYWRPYGTQTGANNILDLSGNAHHGTTSGMTDNNWVGEYPRALSLLGTPDFNGSDEYIDIFSNETVPAAFQNLGESVGVSFFFQQDVSVADASNFWSSAYTILDFRELGGSGDHVPFSIGLNNTKVRLGVSDNFTTGAETADSPTYDDNGWKHVVVNISGDDWEIWLNGVKTSGTFTTATGDRTVGTRASSLTIGSARSSANATLYEFDGNISQMVIKAEPFTPCQVMEIFNGGSPVDDVTALANDNTLLAVYNMDENDDYSVADGVVDRTGNGHHGSGNLMDANNVEQYGRGIPTTNTLTTS